MHFTDVVVINLIINLMCICRNNENSKNLSELMQYILSQTPNLVSLDLHSGYIHSLCDLFHFIQ